MSLITEVSMQKNKSRANVYLDGDFVCGMEISVIMKYGLKAGKEIEREELLILQKESDTSKAMEKALSLLDRQLYTKKQIRDKLKTKGYGDEIIEGVIEKLEEYGYVSDKTFAKSYISSTTGKSKKEIEFNLQTKGISRDIINEAFEDVDNFDESAAEIAANKFMRHKEKTDENKTKLCAFLYRKGFRQGEISRAVLNIFDECD